MECTPAPLNASPKAMQRFTDASQFGPVAAATFSSMAPTPPFGQPIDTDSPLYPLPSTFSIRSRTNSNNVLGTLTLHPNGSYSTGTLATDPTSTSTAEQQSSQWTWTKDYPASVSGGSPRSAAGGFLSFGSATGVSVWAIPTLTEDYPSSRFWIRRVWPFGQVKLLAEKNDEDCHDGVQLPTTAGMLVRHRN